MYITHTHTCKLSIQVSKRQRDTLSRPLCTYLVPFSVLLSSRGKSTVRERMFCLQIAAKSILFRTALLVKIDTGASKTFQSVTLAAESIFQFRFPHSDTSAWVPFAGASPVTLLVSTKIIIVQILTNLLLTDGHDTHYASM